MASRAEACRQKANECATLAGNVADSYSRAQLRETAALWRQMAQSVETVEEIERSHAATAETGIAGTGATHAKPPADPPTRLGNMRELGVHELNLLCLNPACRHELTFCADDYADETELSWFRPRMICGKCGGKRVAVRPNWKEQPSQPTKRRDNGSAPDCSSTITLPELL